MTLKPYVTEQRQLLFSFLKEHPDRQYSIDEIAGELSADTDISISSVYRNINKMVKDGTVRRFAMDGSRKFLYQYIDHEECREHIHLQCESCGKLVHVDDPKLERVLETALDSQAFRIDKRKTVLYGSCKECND